MTDFSHYGIALLRKFQIVPVPCLRREFLTIPTYQQCLFGGMA
jgi:hypothetical protein